MDAEKGVTGFRRWQSMAITANADGFIILVISVFWQPRANEGGNSKDVND